MKKIIIDTDLGCDCDDAGALVSAYALENHGFFEILGITQCTSRLNAAKAIEVFNRYYHRADIPIATYMPDGFLDDKERHWCDIEVARDESLKSRQKKDYEEPVSLMRRLLAKPENNGTVIVGIGAFNNIADLLQSHADEYSDLNGIDLVKKAHCQLVCMAGAFESQTKREFNGRGEFNVVQDLQATRTVLNSWPNEVVFCPFEVGNKIITGQFLAEVSDQHPLRQCYASFDTFERPSWDPCTIHFVSNVNPNLWQLSPKGTICLDQNGVTDFAESTNGLHQYCKAMNQSALQAEITLLMQYRLNNQ